MIEGLICSLGRLPSNITVVYRKTFTIYQVYKDLLRDFMTCRVSERFHVRLVKLLYCIILFEWSAPLLPVSDIRPIIIALLFDSR